MSEILTPRNGEEPSDERPRLVLDTNTVLALWMFRDPKLAVLRGWIESGNCRLHTRADALDELRCVLTYSHFALDAERQKRIYTEYCERSNQFSPRLTEALPAPEYLPKCSDKDDQKFLQIAICTRATHLLTRDKALLKLRNHRHVRNHIVIAQPEGLICAHFNKLSFPWKTQA